jgi:hypothetical protein
LDDHTLPTSGIRSRFQLDIVSEISLVAQPQAGHALNEFDTMSNTSESGLPSGPVPGDDETDRPAMSATQDREMPAFYEENVIEAHHDFHIPEELFRVPTGSTIAEPESVVGLSGRTYHGYKEGRYMLPNDGVSCSWSPVRTSPACLLAEPRNP